MTQSNSHHRINPIINEIGVEMLVKSNRSVRISSRVAYRSYLKRLAWLQSGNNVEGLLTRLGILMQLSGKTIIAIALIILLITGVSAEAFFPQRYKPSTLIREISQLVEGQQQEPTDLQSEQSEVDQEPMTEPASDNIIEPEPLAITEPEPTPQPQVDLEQASEPEPELPPQYSFNWNEYNHGPMTKSVLVHPYFPSFAVTVPAGWSVETSTVNSSRFDGFKNYIFIFRKQDITIALYAQPGYIGFPMAYRNFLDQGNGWGYTNHQQVGTSSKGLVSKTSSSPNVGEQTILYGSNLPGAMYLMNSNFTLPGPEINVNTNKNTYRMFVSVNQAGATPFLSPSQQNFTYIDNTIAPNHSLIPEVDALVGSIQN